MTLNKLISRLSKSLFMEIAAMVVLAVLSIIGIYLSLMFYTHHGNTVKVPKVIGKDIKEARALLEEAGLRVVVSDTDYVKKYAADLILDQSVPAGATVKFNRPVFLTINSNQPRQKPLPEIIDGSARSAEIKLKSMGFKIGQRKLVPGDEDLVMAVEVGGKRVETGQRISIESPIVLIVGNGEVDEKYNGNDSIDWAFHLRIQEEEQLNREASQDIRNRLNARPVVVGGAVKESEAPVEEEHVVAPVTPVHITTSDLTD